MPSRPTAQVEILISPFILIPVILANWRKVANRYIPWRARVSQPTLSIPFLLMPARAGPTLAPFTSRAIRKMGVVSGLVRLRVEVEEVRRYQNLQPLP